MEISHLKNRLFLRIATFFYVAMLFSCSQPPAKELTAVQGIFPLGEGQNVRLVYTDSARVKAELFCKEYKDFSNQSFPYAEFPKGLKMSFLDKEKNQNTVLANYGIYYYKTRMVELRDSVRLITFDGKKLSTDQLFWQEQADWIFTEKPFVYTDSVQGSITRGVGMDFDKNFSKVKARKITGILPLKEFKNEQK